ncbi:hypothetical protein [Nitratireductor thuwali]|uniref:DUF3311 domain-containing protein n=1 Tax=Nitratireductor thuwali TaxID=2267699 RepID=A0ABY5MMJ9_9HYPH|nr:hypothetical protein NTH_02790 [Nitratireductor thuwali]
MSRWEAGARSTRDAAVLLPVAAAALLLPPFILVFAAPVYIAGVPLIVVYVFSVWAGVVLCAWLLARRHAEAPDGMDAAAEAETAAGPQPGRR